MAETRESLIEKIQGKEAEVRELEVRCEAYWDSASRSGLNSRSSFKENHYAYEEAKRLSRQINSRRSTIMKMYEKLRNMQ